jgi:predicted DNA-binding transcriptional regulator YafY
MSRVAAYAQRLAALPRALAILELHPAGLPLADLAAELGVQQDDLREVFMAYYLADLVELGSFGQPVVEFFAPDADDVDPATAQWVRVVARDPEQELGVDHLSAEQLGRLFEAGADLLALEPDNETLRSALAAFSAALWPADGPSGSDWKAPIARQLHQAAQEQRQVRITYVRQWHPGAGERVVEPYRLVRTRRGWEVDAGPPDDVAAVRTFLVSGIQTCEVLDEHFVPPADVDELLAAQRTPVAVEIVVPQDRRWAVDRYAESVTVLDDDEESVSLRADLLPPVDPRLGLILLCCGPDAFVVQPRSLEDAGVDLAGLLSRHHGGPGS